MRILWVVGKRIRIWMKHYRQMKERITPGQKREIRNKAHYLGRQISKKIAKIIHRIRKHCFRMQRFR